MELTGRSVPLTPTRALSARAATLFPASAADALRIGGLTPLSTIDYPGELACVLYCQGCPWRCGYCHNAHLIPSLAGDTSWSRIRDFLSRRRGLLDAVVFSGGEPTAQRVLVDAVDDVRRLDFKVGLHSSGVYPHRLARLLPKLDWVALDIKALAGDYEAITGVANSGERAFESLDLILSSGLNYEVRTTVPPDWDEQRLLGLVSELLRRGVRSYALQRCNSTQTLKPLRVPTDRLDLADFARHHHLGDTFKRFAVRQDVAA